ncbi:MAG: hypothetical protein KF736_01555 [Acidobacteria bacterium]|nr:hypothetical protein [Acidobacteriota bacterium]MCW5948162.1 hypothetical protein [Pyrinomonadaceae bacterium]
MLVRAIALSVALLVGIGVILPLGTNEAEAGPRHKRKKHRKHYKKYSKQWWKQYRARQKKRRAHQARIRSLRLQQMRLAAERATQIPVEKTAAAPVARAKKAAVLPSGEAAPKGFKEVQAPAGEVRFRVDDSAGMQVGSASISVVGPAAAAPAAGSQKTVGGVPTSALRREVINKMIQENGWVVNDYQKDINGRQVYVVVAQSQARNGQVQSRMFYFTEVDGRIYNVATNASADQAERLAEESEKVLSSIQSRIQTTQRASFR